MNKENESKDNTKPYQRPQITRVVLRRDQAILSTCSSSKADNTNTSGADCYPALCGKTIGGGGDNADSS
ncbi:MAG: hypothetical protein AABZ06_00075 [Bdellovibrionota bacterium]